MILHHMTNKRRADWLGPKTKPMPNVYDRSFEERVFNLPPHATWRELLPILAHHRAVISMRIAMGDV